MSKIVMNNTKFKLGVEKLQGKIVAEQGIVSLHCPERNLVVPLDFFVSYEYFDTDVEFYYRPSEHKVIMELGEDDKLIETLKDNELDIANSKQEVFDYLESYKLKFVKRVLFSFVLCFITLLCLIINAVLLFTFHKFILAGWLIGVIAFIVSCLYASDCVGVMSSSVVYDSYGNYVDVNTGMHNLSGGGQISFYGKSNY